MAEKKNEVAEKKSAEIIPRKPWILCFFRNGIGNILADSYI